MFDGFFKATKKDLSCRKNVVYIIVFDNGNWYCGSTSQTFRLRYGTSSLKNSQLLANKSVKNAAEKYGYSVFLSTRVFTCDKERKEEEYRIIDAHVIKNSCCLNRFGDQHNYGTMRAIELRSPSGDLVSFESLKDAVREIGVKSHTTISNVLSGKVKSVKGWTLPSHVGPVANDINKKKITLLSPTGQLFEFDSYTEAARAINCNHNNICELVAGRNTTVAGWCLPEKTKRKYLPVKLIDTNGRVRVFSSRMAASEAIGCSNQLVSMLCVGKATSAKGWTLAEPPVNREGR